MNKAVLLRFGTLSIVSVGAAVGGTALSQPEQTPVVASALRAPALKPSVIQQSYGSIADDSALWQAAYSRPATTVQAANQETPLNPWRLIGVIGDGKGAKAVFSAPGDPMQTVFVKAGESLPDGRTVSSVSDSQVQFASDGQRPAPPTGGRPGSQAAELTGIPADVLNLFQGVDLTVPRGATLGSVQFASSPPGEGGAPSISPTNPPAMARSLLDVN